MRPALPLAAFLLYPVLLCCASAAFSQAEPEVEGNNRPLWEAGVAGIGLGGPAYPGAAGNVNRTIVVPWFIYRGPILRADGGTVGARVMKTETLEFDIGFAAALGASSEDVAIRRGMPDLGFQFEFGPRARINLLRPTPDSVVRLDLPLRGVFEAKDGINARGVSFEPRLSYSDRDIGGGFGLTATAGAVFGDRKYTEFLYGVPNAFASASRRAYQAKSGLITTRLQFALTRRITPDIVVFGYARQDFSGNSANSDSPLHLKNGGTSFGLGATWTIGKSSEKGAP